MKTLPPGWRVIEGGASEKKTTNRLERLEANIRDLVAFTIAAEQTIQKHRNGRLHATKFLREMNSCN